MFLDLFDGGFVESLEVDAEIFHFHFLASDVLRLIFGTVIGIWVQPYRKSLRSRNTFHQSLSSQPQSYRNVYNSIHDTVIESPFRRSAILVLLIVVIQTLIMHSIRIPTNLVQLINPNTSILLHTMKLGEGVIHTHRTPSDLSTLFKTSAWTMCIPFLFATHHKVVVVGFTECADEEGGRFECCRGGSHFGHRRDKRGHGTGFYHAGNFGGVH